ncbi:MAG TPA: pseudouridine synthase [Chitinispirillaceae bacterium]|nr:pseudouridine synthase [Chitinispirillaceae bacterium]
MERVDKILSNLGYCSRRGADLFLRSHQVCCNNIRIKNGSEKADAHLLLIDGQKPDNPDGLFILMNKPSGYVCSHDRTEGTLVYDLLPKQWMNRTPLPSTIGRLDKDTTGVLLITDNTALNHQLSSPRRKIEKIYEVSVDKELNRELTGIFASGNLHLTGEQKPCLPADLKIIEAFRASLTIHEGRYHQVKRMFSTCGYKVTSLHRSRFGIYTVDNLKEGEYKVLPFPDQNMVNA